MMNTGEDKYGEHISYLLLIENQRLKVKKGFKNDFSKEYPLFIIPMDADNIAQYKNPFNSIIEIQLVWGSTCLAITVNDEKLTSFCKLDKHSEVFDEDSSDIEEKERKEQLKDHQRIWELEIDYYSFDHEEEIPFFKEDDPDKIYFAMGYEHDDSSEEEVKDNSNKNFIYLYSAQIKPDSNQYDDFNKTQEGKIIDLNSYPMFLDITQIQVFKADRNLKYFFVENQNKQRLVSHITSNQNMLLEGDDFIHILSNSQFRTGIYLRQNIPQSQTTQIVRAFCERKQDGGFKRLKLDARNRCTSNFIENSKDMISSVVHPRIQDKDADYNSQKKKYKTGNKIIEVINNPKTQEISITSTNTINKRDQKVQFLRLNSDIKVFYPFFCVVEGTSSLKIRDLHSPKVELNFKLKKGQKFLCFLSDSKMLEDFEVRHKFLKDNILTQFNFLTSDDEGYKIQKIILEPYIRELNVQNDLNRQMSLDFYEMNLKHFEVPQSIPAEHLDSKQVIQCGMGIVPDFQKGARIELPALVSQYSDCIEISCLYSKYKIAINESSNNLAPVRAVILNSQELYPYQACLFATHEQMGSTISLCSFLQGRNQVFSILAREQTTKIQILVKKEKWIYSIDEQFVTKQYSIKGTGRRSERKNIELELSKIFSTNQLAQSQLNILLQNEKDFFFPSQITDDNYLSLKGCFFQLHEKQDDSTYEAKYQEIDFQDICSFYEKELKTVQGPYQIDKSQYLTVLKQENEGEKVKIEPASNSKQSLLLGYSPKFITFLSTPQLGKERILVQTETGFFIYKPNGIKVCQVIMTEDDIFDSLIPEIKKLIGFRIMTTSNSMRFFNLVYQLKDPNSLQTLSKIGQGIVENFLKHQPVKTCELMTYEQGMVGTAYHEDMPQEKKGWYLFKKRYDYFQTPQHRANFKEVFEENSLYDFLVKGARVKIKLLTWVDNLLQSERYKNKEEFNWDKVTQLSHFGMTLSENGKTSEIFDYNGVMYFTQRKQIYPIDSFPTPVQCAIEDIKQQHGFAKLKNDYQMHTYKEKLMNEEEKKEEEKKQKIEFFNLIVLKDFIAFYQVKEGNRYIISSKFKINSYTQKLMGLEACKILTNKYMEGGTLLNVQGLNFRNQLVFHIRLPKESDQIESFCVWNFERNKEEICLDLGRYRKESDNFYVKGVNSAYDYAWSNGRIYDLEYTYPVPYFPKINSNQGKLEKIGTQENLRSSQLLICESKDMFIFLKKGKVMIQHGLCLTEKRQIQNFIHAKKNQVANQILKRLSLPLNLTKFVLPNGENIFHLLIHDQVYLKIFLRNLQKKLDMIDDQEVKSETILGYLQILMANNRNKSPFDIALKQSSSLTDIFLRCLNNVDGWLMSRHVFKSQDSFSYLLRLNLESFEAFLERCTHQSEFMKSVKRRNWPWKKLKFYSMQRSMNLSEMQIAKKAGAQPTEQDEKEAKKEFNRVLARMVDMDKIFDEPFCFDFINSLASSPSESIFEVEAIKVSITHLWKFYFRQILKKVFLPQVAYFIVFIIFSSYIYSEETYSSDSEGRYLLVHILFGIAIFLWAIYLFYEEVQQIKSQKIQYFYSSSTFWNVVDLSSTIMVIAFTICDFIEVNYTTGKNVAAIASFLIWLKMFYFLRIFHPTAAFIRMITEVMKDISIFTMMLVLALLAFGNGFFILDGASTDVIKTRAMGKDFWQAFAFTYQSGLGEFTNDDYGVAQHTTIIWIIFVFCTLFIQILFLNMLIAIIADTFDKVQEIKEQAQLKECCRLMAENWHLIKFRNRFKLAKYIIIYQVELADAKKNKGWEGRLTHLKSWLQGLVKELKQQMRFMQSQQKDDVGKVQRNLSYQLTNLQHYMHKKHQATEITTAKIGTELSEAQKEWAQVIKESKEG